MLNTSLTFSLPADWKVEWDASARTPLAYSYMMLHSTFSSDIAANKSFFDGALTLNFAFNDIFRTSIQNLDVYDPATGKPISYFGQQYLLQRVKVGLTWRFGKSSSTRRRNVGDLEEASRAGGGSGIGR